MSEGLNRVILLGRLGADPELRYTTGGTAVLNMRLATNESFVDRNKELQERTDWHQVVVWGARAEGLSKILMKGACLLIEGGLRTSSYEKDGSKRYKTEIHAREICLAGRRPAAAVAAALELDEEPLERAAPPSVDGATAGAGRSAGPRRASARDEPVTDDLPY
jgi:single-strand DNA-binding protein